MISWTAAALLLAAGLPAAGDPLRVRSPDGRNEIELAVQDGALTYVVRRDGTEVIDRSALRVRLADAGELGAAAQVLAVTESPVDERFELPWGKCVQARLHGARARVRLADAAGVEWEVELFAAGDGVAFRYAILEQPDAEVCVIEAEGTEFRLAREPRLLFTALPHFRTSHEAPYAWGAPGDLPADQVIDMPLLAVFEGGHAALLTEARLRGFAGLYLERDAADGTPILRGRLAPLPAGNGAAVRGPTPLVSPWRVVLLADQAGRLHESNLLLGLNDPPAGDFAWLEPGKSTWHWWNGTHEDGLPFATGMNYATHARYIDFAAAHGIAYHALVADDRPWYMQSGRGFGPREDTDILAPRPELELPRLVELAREKGVGLRLWVHWQPFGERLEQALAQYEAWGVRGLMVDFLDRDDQEMVEYCDRVLEAAARHRIHIQFHGSYKPSGEQRTYPNLFNREGVLNLEYSKWTALCTPDHDLSVAYTRALAGPTDYHLGGFRAVPAARFVPKDVSPDVLGTRAHQLALYVILENPMPMLCDTPSAYAGQAGFDFLVKVPTTWDETRYVAGAPGESLVLARRKGADWYLGGITGDAPRDLAVGLGFLGAGEHEIDLYLDGDLDGGDPNALRRASRRAGAADRLALRLAAGGGFAAVIRRL